MPFRAIAPERRGNRVRLYYVWWKVARVMMCSDYYYCILHSASSQSIISVGRSGPDTVELNWVYSNMFRCFARRVCDWVRSLLLLESIAAAHDFGWMAATVSLTLFKISSQCNSICTIYLHMKRTCRINSQSDKHTYTTHPSSDRIEQKEEICLWISNESDFYLLHTDCRYHTTAPNAFYVLPLRRW